MSFRHAEGAVIILARPDVQWILQKTDTRFSTQQILS
jgi:hypothetical protein